MKLPASCVAWLLPLLLTACFHRAHQVSDQPLAPPLVEPLPSPPQSAPADLPPPVITVPGQPAPAATTTAPPPPQETPKPPVHHHKPANAPPQQASNGNPGVSAIGELSSGGAADSRLQTQDLIASTERGLNAITRPLSSSDQKTADHIRDFLKQAKAALASGDVDGANTLAAKAKVLLGELTR
jgi:hypothetical protein